jgi:hypothetical protein
MVLSARRCLQSLTTKPTNYNEQVRLRPARELHNRNQRQRPPRSKSRPGSASKKNRAERDLIQNQPIQPP